MPTLELSMQLLLFI